MRLIGLSILVLSGALMASAGTIANSLPGVARYNDLPLYGLLLAGVATVMFIIEWWPISNAPSRALSSGKPREDQTTKAVPVAVKN
jgi:hypothetical protein